MIDFVVVIYLLITFPNPSHSGDQRQTAVSTCITPYNNSVPECIGHRLMKREALWRKFQFFVFVHLADAAKLENPISRGILVVDQTDLFLIPGYPFSRYSVTSRQI